VLKNGDDRPPRRYTSLKKSIAFLLTEGLPYYVKNKIAVTLNTSARASLPQRLEFYRKLMIAKHWLLYYREYDKNLLALNEFKVRLRKSKKTVISRETQDFRQET
jgi:acyl carrier protein phosphodiesterase